MNLAAAFAAFDERWSPRVAAELNGQQVKLAKLEGPFVWHHHAEEDELFLVVHGRLTLRFRDGDTALEDVTLEAGEMLVVPRGVEHMPVADGECHVLLFEPAATLNTGNVENARTVRDLKRV
ncbi:MAG TPA: cupin domain-containing protein [Rhodothermales bacterium]|nr:cupin domain-containing protein [Rhodothermales bacterium]